MKRFKRSLIGSLATVAVVFCVASAVSLADVASQDKLAARGGTQSTTTANTATPDAPVAPEPDVPTAQPSPSPADAQDFEINWQSISGGGAINTMSPSYRLSSSIGQSAIGSAMSENYQAGIGFWYGAAGSGSCACLPCFADPMPNPVCDGVVNVFDVVAAVDVAFRAGTPVTDAGCPRERTDVDCNGVTNVFDVVKFVDVAFRAGDPALAFCNPCL